MARRLQGGGSSEPRLPPVTRRRGWSDITVTDQFCGAGGSSIGAQKAGLRVRMAMNHWELAVESHNTNFPDTDHDCCDISASDPRRYPSTDILITSPECTTHSPAGGNKKRTHSQRDLFIPSAHDPANARSRATMWDVPRFTEYHEYRRIIVENVVEAYTQWPLFSTWLRAMHVLGYRHRIVSLNSMFCLPTPQSRDRIYIHFWKQGDRAPDLSFSPPAPCARCCRIVEARQTWKNGRVVGKYGRRNQYIYTCADCRLEVVPFYYAALNAIDFSIPSVRIGDRAPPLRPLKDRTRERIRFGLEKYGRRHLMIRTNMTSGVECRVRGLDGPAFTQTASWLDGLVSPFIVETAYSDCPSSRTRGAVDPLAPQTTQQSGALVSPFLVKLRGTSDAHLASSASGMADPTPTLVASGFSAALVSPFAPFIAMRRVGMTVKGVEDALPTVTTAESQHLLVQGAAFISLRDAGQEHVSDLSRPLRTQGKASQMGLMSPTPFVVSYYGADNVSELSEPIPAVTTLDRHAVVAPQSDLRVDDCYFRMLQPPEIGSAMAFPREYVVLGNKSEMVRQYGNAVTPPTMEAQLQRQVQAMTGERVA